MAKRPLKGHRADHADRRARAGGVTGDHLTEVTIEGLIVGGAHHPAKPLE
jgi:hypothetical protein